jgi:hypothetical protein
MTYRFEPQKTGSATSSLLSLYRKRHFPFYGRNTGNAASAFRRINRKAGFPYTAKETGNAASPFTQETGNATTEKRKRHFRSRAEMALPTNPMSLNPMKNPLKERLRLHRSILKKESAAKDKEDRMKNTNWQRPTLRVRGRLTEDIAGADVPAEFRTAPKPQVSKAGLRSEAEAAMEAFAKPRQPKEHAPRPSAQPDELPPWI